MRAKLIYEEFKEDSDPIQDLDIGGINFNQQFNDLFEKSMKFLEGKTITAKMIKHWTERGGISKESRLSKQTIKVAEVDPPHLEQFGGFNYKWSIHLDDEEGNRYSLDLDQKIYIKHES